MHRISQASRINDHLTDADVLLTRAEAAAYLRRSVPALERWARDGSGPRFSMIGGRALYPLVELRAFVGVSSLDRGAQR